MIMMMICDWPMTASEINGGVAAAAFNLVHALLRNTDMEIVVIGYWHAFHGSKPEITTDGRLKVIRLPSPAARAHLRNYGRERRLFRQFLDAEKPDLIHAQGEGIYASLAVNSGYPNVYTIHGIGLKEFDMIRQELGFLRHWMRTRLIRQHHRGARHIVAINEYTRKEVEGLHRAKIHVIRNAVDDHYFDLQSDDGHEPGRLLLVGGVRPRKDILNALGAMVWLRENGVSAELDICGPNDADYQQSITTFIEKNGLVENVRIHGLVDEKTLDELYRRADIALLTSVEESSPIAIVQAMAAGKPIVSTNVGGIAEMVREGQDGFLVDPDQPEMVGERVARLLNDRSLRDRIATSAHRNAVDNWSARSVALQTNAMYEEILNDW